MEEADRKPEMSITSTYGSPMLENLSSAITVTPVQEPIDGDSLGHRVGGREGDEYGVSTTGRLGNIDSYISDIWGGSSEYNDSFLSDSPMDRLSEDDSLAAYSICLDCDKVVLTADLDSHGCTGNEDIEFSVDQMESDNEKENETVGSHYTNYMDESRRNLGIFSCHECPLVFTSSEDLGLHLKAHPVDGSGSFRCCECQKSFKTYEVLQKHERIHNGTAPYPCSLCEKTFNQPVHLKAHMRKHEGVTPYKCSECPKAYTDRTSLTYHINSSHTGVQLIKCLHCPRKFTKKCAWQVHVNAHLRDKTAKGQADSIKKKNLTMAVKSQAHSEKQKKVVRTAKTQGEVKGTLIGKDPLFNCLHCNKGFQSSSGVRKHERIHEGNEKFSCQTCFQLFPSLLQMKAHQRKEHWPGTTVVAALTDQYKDLQQPSSKECDLNFICASCSFKFPDVASLNQHKISVHS